MKQNNGWYLPDYDKHFIEWMKENNETTYQRLQREYAIKQVKKFRTAIDIGGNIGFWSKDFCKLFQHVEIFEPDKSNLECLYKNLEPYKNYNINEVGLGQEETTKNFYISTTTSGGHSVFRNQVFEENVLTSSIEIKKLDNYQLENVDLIKIDTQGSEFDILQGAIETLQNNNCVLNIEIEHKNDEQKKKGKEIIDFLKNLNYIEFGRSRKKEVVFTKIK